MTAPATFQTLLDCARATHQTVAAVRDFCPFPDRLTDASFASFTVPAADLLATDPYLAAQNLSPFAQAVVDAGADAHWRETYKDTDIDADFIDRFGAFSFVGPDAPWTSADYAGFVVYMPAGLWYPRHEHPAEELYYILAGEADFLADGRPPRTVGAGGTIFHESSQPHATQTHDKPVLAYVLWRNNLGVKPVWSDVPK